MDPNVPRAPRRENILTESEERLALANALRYFPAALHPELAPEFAEELRTYGRIYMYRYRPHHEMKARPIQSYPARSVQAAAIMHMIQNNLDPAVAQHPYELVTYGGNGAVFRIGLNIGDHAIPVGDDEEQTLVMYSGHPLGLFPSHPDAPRSGRDQRDGHPELFVCGRLYSDVRARCVELRPDDRR